MPNDKPADPAAAPIVPPKKRRKPSNDAATAAAPPAAATHDDDHDEMIEDEDEDEEQQQQQQQQPKRHHRGGVHSTPPFQPAMMALPPPLLSYPAPHHQVAYYHPLYPAGPFYLPVGSSPPLPPHQPSAPATPRARGGTGTAAARILPKAPPPADGTSHSPATGPAAPCFASPPLQPNSAGEFLYHHPPFSIPIASAPPDPSAARRDSTTADQREQARKMSHSAIERRRRERINDKIVQLRQLIPSCANQEHLHKMTVLQSAIDYIAYLKQVVARLDGEESLNVNLKNTKAPRSMMPREVEAFTTQFSVTKSRRRSNSSNSSTASDAHKQASKAQASRPDGNAAPASASSFDARQGIKPIDVIRAGVSCQSPAGDSGDTALLGTSAPSPSSVHSHEWSSSAAAATAAASSHTLPPPWTPTTDHTSQRQRTDSNHDSSPETVASSWTEDGTTCSSPALPTPSLTPQSGPSQQKHMSLQNLLC